MDSLVHAVGAHAVAQQVLDMTSYGAAFQGLAAF